MSTNDDMGTRLAALEARLQVLEDTNAIRNLKSRYAELCDDNYNPDGIAALFAEDAVWENESLGRYEGREAIREFFVRASSIFTFAIHYSLTSQIEVTGDRARAQWFLFMPCTLGANNEAMWRAGIDREEYARIDGAWLFTYKHSTPLFHSPYDKGWSRDRFAGA